MISMGRSPQPMTNGPHWPPSVCYFIATQLWPLVYICPCLLLWYNEELSSFNRDVTAPKPTLSPTGTLQKVCQPIIGHYKADPRTAGQIGRKRSSFKFLLDNFTVPQFDSQRNVHPPALFLLLIIYVAIQLFMCLKIYNAPYNWKPNN